MNRERVLKQITPHNKHVNRNVKSSAFDSLRWRCGVRLHERYVKEQDIGNNSLRKQIMESYKNPYRPGAGTKPLVIAGRNEEIDKANALFKSVKFGAPPKVINVIWVTWCR